MAITITYEIRLWSICKVVTLYLISFLIIIFVEIGLKGKFENWVGLALGQSVSKLGANIASLNTITVKKVKQEMFYQVIDGVETTRSPLINSLITLGLNRANFCTSCFHICHIEFNLIPFLDSLYIHVCSYSHHHSSMFHANSLHFMWSCMVSILND